MLEINNLTTTKIDENFLKEIAKIVLKGEKKEGNISLAFIGPNRMRKLNKKYRGKNRVTDVLAFEEKGLTLQPWSQELQKVQGLGEIVICLREVKKNSKRLNEPFEKELARVFLHGILHLLGYDHEKSEEESEKMKEKEEKYLKGIVKLGNE
ncbi:MAG: rRNA maturation RNase YbeY [Candidatus Nealsonbacteria bacterium]|nr:MAG: rRNA maturation RNase YbeY [Candidatus Nealsonbacteria bacterium]